MNNIILCGAGLCKVKFNPCNVGLKQTLKNFAVWVQSILTAIWIDLDLEISLDQFRWIPKVLVWWEGTLTAIWIDQDQKRPI